MTGQLKNLPTSESLEIFNLRYKYLRSNKWQLSPKKSERDASLKIGVQKINKNEPQRPHRFKEESTGSKHLAGAQKRLPRVKRFFYGLKGLTGA